MAAVVEDVDVMLRRVRINIPLGQLTAILFLCEWINNQSFKFFYVTQLHAYIYLTNTLF